MRIKYQQAIKESEEELSQLEQGLRGQKGADRVRLLLVLFLAFWWLMPLAASCVHNDRGDKGHLRLGRLYLRDIERVGHERALRECLPLRRHHHQ